MDFGFNITVFDLLINNLDLTDIKATFTPDPQKVEKGIIVNVVLSAEAKGDVHVNQTEGGDFINLAGKFDAIASKTAIQLGLEFVKGPDGLIETVDAIADTCNVQIGSLTADITIPTEEWLQWLVDLLKDPIIDLLKDYIGPMVCKSAPAAIGDAMTKVFNMTNTVIRPFLNETSPILIPVGSNMYDLRKSPIINAVRFLSSKLIGINGPLNLNVLMNKFSNNTGFISIRQLIQQFGVSMPFKFSVPIQSLNASINLSLNELNFSGMNTWNEFNFIDPIDAYTLDTHTGMEELGINLSFTINVSADGSIISTGETFLSEAGDLDMILHNNSMNMRLQVASPVGAGVNYTNTQCTDINCLKNLLSTEGTGSTYLKFITSIESINLIASKQDMEVKIREFINNIVKLFVENYREIIPPFLNSYINTYVLQIVNEKLNQLLINENDCPYLPDPPYNEFVAWTTLLAVGVGAGLVFIMLIIVLIVQKCRKNETNLNSSLMTSINEDGMYTNETTDIKSSSNTYSLIMSPKLSIFVRILMPFLICMNIALFVSSNTGIGASVFIKFAVGSKIVSLPSMFDFGLINSIVDMWKAKAYALSILVAVMSCAWPYLKLLLMLLIWILPTKILSKKRRESFLKLLDALGKWSLLDSYVMILMLVAFNMKLKIPEVEDDINGDFTIFLWVYPAYGFVTLMIGTLFSLLLSHIILAIDRYVDDSMEDIDTDEEKVTLFKLCKSGFLRWFTTIMLFGVFFAIIAGIYFKSFSFNFVGLLGWAMSLIPIANYNEYSVLNLAIDLPEAAEYPNSFGLRFTQVLYLIVTIVMPMIHILTMIILWLTPLKRKIQKGLYKTCEVMYAWSCLDVFVIAVLAAVLEISQFAQFMVGDKCDMIDPIVQQYFSQEEYVKGHETCFQVITVLLKGAYIMVGAAVMHDLTTIVVNIVARRSLEGKKEDEMENDKTSQKGIEYNA
ncbi:hypothetical protein GPJ56_004060 [Histomonas meleagridis]|uniref:uncharacterized protein n=1 Tax=Histomonas meleagridis TaxID=135588 RepID=UPI0035599855|nr:hypothetical protein GPJ56_004060 [Histomonas meleagridis]KAH0800586.1 hypothetical protein GO595_006339 [Histomonas meleagridis]